MFVLPTLILTFSIYNFPELYLGQIKKKKNFYLQPWDLGL